jgi:hypothetical protein
VARQLDVAEASLRFSSGGVRCQPARYQLRRPRLEVKRDLCVHILLGESRALDGEPKESTGARGEEHQRAEATFAAAVRIPLTISE